MRLWRVCTEGMEKIITDLTIFDGYKDLQVVLNFYEDEDVLFQRDGFHFYEDEDVLFQRDGFHFHSLEFLSESEELLFTKMDGSCCTITIKNYSDRYIDSQFPNYFVLRNGSERMDIYFPA